MQQSEQRAKDASPWPVNLAKAVFAICLPVLLLTSSLRLAINSPRLYEYGFDKYGVSAASGIPEGDLHRVAEGLVRYFNSGDDLFNMTITRYGQQELLFHENESVHFRDVKDLFQFDYRMMWGTLAYVLLFAAVVLLARRRQGWRDVLSAFKWGSALTIGLMVVLGIAMLVDFNGVFIGFHELFFSNNLWIALSGDVMTTLFPEEFFRDALAMVAGLMAFEAIVLLVLSWRALRPAAPAVGR